MKTFNTTISFNYVNYKDEKKKNRQDVALQILSKLKTKNLKILALGFDDEKYDLSNLPCEFDFLNCLKRNSLKEINNTKKLPYIKEILNVTEKYSNINFGFINSDILLNKDFFKIFSLNKDAYIFYRTEITETTYSDFINEKFKKIYGGDSHSGNDAFFFKKEFWLNNSSCFHDDLILGETEWDTYYRNMISLLTKNYYIGRNLYHVYHDPQWNLNTAGAKNNIKIWENFFKENKVNIQLKN